MSTRMMRNTRTGKVAVYDSTLVEDGRWEEVVEPPKYAAPKPAAKDDVAVMDEIKVTLTKGKSNEGKQRKT